MALSSSSVIHFTEDKNSLFGILSDNFHVCYCTEEYDLDVAQFWLKVPMVSFCDIPLSQIKEHIGSYGPYGIGLTKEWAAKNGLNPVLYIEPTSVLAINLQTAFKEFLPSSSKGNVGATTVAQVALADVLRYVKNYQGNLTRKGKTTKNYRYSDEREWRYVPPIDEAYQMIIGRADYESGPAIYDASLSTLRLKFVPNDIKYIIIKDDSEISECLEHLRHAKGKNYSYSDIERLSTRLLTTEQIMSDI